MNDPADRRSKAPLHRGPDHSAPYPVSRLAPPVDLVDLAREIARADQMLEARTGAQLRVIAEQMKMLQAQARRILEQARLEADLNHARCGFKKVPGRTYHLYRQAGGTLAFSLLSPEEWGTRPPHAYLGSYRLESDLSWSRADRAGRTNDSQGAQRFSE